MLTYTHGRRRFSIDLPSPWAGGPVGSYFVPRAARRGGPSELPESKPLRHGPQASPRRRRGCGRRLPTILKSRAASRSSKAAALLTCVCRQSESDPSRRLPQYAGWAASDRGPTSPTPDGVSSLSLRGLSPLSSWAVPPSPRGLSPLLYVGCAPFYTWAEPPLYVGVAPSIRGRSPLLSVG